MKMHCRFITVKNSTQQAVNDTRKGAESKSSSAVVSGLLRGKKEEWRPVVGYEGLYEVSDRGRVRSLDRVVNRGIWGKYVLRGKIRKQVESTKGYFHIQFRGNQKVSKTMFVHRVVAQAFIPNILEKQFINHIDAVKKNNKIENLEWCSHKENIAHASALGLWKDSSQGEKNNNSKLSAKQVLEIRALKGKVIRKRIAKKYKIGMMQITKIWSRTMWPSI